MNLSIMIDALELRVNIFIMQEVKKRNVNAIFIG
jgi:hypothetical protein